MVLLSVPLALVAACSRGKDEDAGASAAMTTTAPAVNDADAARVAAPVDASTVSTASARLVGRFAPDGAGGARFAWSGSAMIARFDGTSLSVKLRDEGPSSFQIVVDGDESSSHVLRTSPSREIYPVAHDLTPGVHEVLVYRRTEAHVGETTFLGFEAGDGGALLPAPLPARRRLEVLGDSISAGYGNEGPGPLCGYSPSQENAFSSYGAIAARKLGADHTILAWSGKTVREMTEYFEHALPARADDRWDFASSSAPQVVVVNLGTNDFANVDPGEERFVQRYVALVRRIRAAYPSAFVVCMLGPMLSDVYPEGRANLTHARRYLQAAVAAIKAAGDANVDLLEVPEQRHSDGLGCGFHPSVKTHQLVAERLVSFLESKRLPW